MKLIIGLGNIGPHYDGSRHNAGFGLVELAAGIHNIEWSNKDRFRAHIAEGEIHGQKVLLAKPTTYYNLSGEAGRAIRDFYKINNEDILVIHDEIDLPFGTVRARIGGTSAGNNGIQNLIDHLGPDFARVRIGIANDHLTTTDAVDFVLGKFSHDENKQLGKVNQAALELLDLFIDDNKKFEHTSVRIEETKVGE